uniref:Glucosamine 6-phosphate N-acetyltransferase n=1 Tax=Panagrolaimus sp. JU765 TaxID=591449 RepID=A0AC34QPA5_9BILA
MSRPNSPFVFPPTETNGDSENIPVQLFPNEILEDVCPAVPEGYLMRSLKISDLENGFTDLLAQLTVVGDVTKQKLKLQFSVMAKTVPLRDYIVVIEEISTGKIVGSSTLVIEWKFIHAAGCRGRIEDVVVDKTKRGYGFGKLLNQCLVGLAKKIGVYKLSLECKDNLIPFYEQFGYKKDEGNNFLVQRFD